MAVADLTPRALLVDQAVEAQARQACSETAALVLRIKVARAETAITVRHHSLLAAVAALAASVEMQRQTEARQATAVLAFLRPLLDQALPEQVAAAAVARLPQRARQAQAAVLVVVTALTEQQAAQTRAAGVVVVVGFPVRLEQVV